MSVTPGQTGILPHWLAARRNLVALGLAILLFRGWLAVALPMTGDEAYFTWWGWRPDWGFYDHPPMIGWWLAGLLQVSDAPWWLRLPSVVQPLLLALAVGWLLPRLLPDLAPQRRHAVVLLVMLAPLAVWNVLVTTDTALVYFSVLSGLAWLRAAQERPEDGFGWYLCAGLLLAGAVLSKYFVAFLGFAFLIDTARRRTRKAWAGLLLCYALCIPALALMAWWNAEHCWSNYMFNFVNRNRGAGLNWQTPLLYVVTLVYALSPPVVWLALSRPASADFSHRHGAHDSIVTLACLAGVPLILFALLSGPKTIGLHWLLSFIPFAMVWIGLRAAPAVLRTMVNASVVVALFHVAAAITLASLPMETWKRTKFYPSLVLTADHEAFGAAVAGIRRELGPGWVVAMDGYSNAVTLGYKLREHVLVFGLGSFHARHDDILTDWRAHDGRNFLVLRKSEPRDDEYAPYFESLVVSKFMVREATFWRIEGRGFKFSRYRDEVLSKIRSRFYQLPPWLPQTGCYFCDRYFSGEVCVR